MTKYRTYYRLCIYVCVLVFECHLGIRHFHVIFRNNPSKQNVSHVNMYYREEINNNHKGGIRSNNAFRI